MIRTATEVIYYGDGRGNAPQRPSKKRRDNLNLLEDNRAAKGLHLFSGSSEAKTKEHTILVVEDHPDTMTLLISALKKEYRIRLAHNGQEAWEAAQKESFKQARKGREV